MRAIGGNAVEAIGTTQLGFKIGNVRFYEQMEVLPTVGQGVDAILGLDFLIRHHAKIDLWRRTVELDGKIFPLSKTVANVSVAQDAPLARVASNELCVSALKIDSHDRVPPGTGRLIWVPVDTSVPQDVLCLVEPLSSNDVLDEQHCCFVRRCVALTRNIGGQLMVPVSLDNFGKMNFLFRKDY